MRDRSMHATWIRAAVRAFVAAAGFWWIGSSDGIAQASTQSAGDLRTRESLHVMPAVVIAHGIGDAGEYGTAWLVAQDSVRQYYLTAAHLIDRPRYLQNNQDPAGNIMIDDPVDGTSKSATIIGDPDFVTDLVLLATDEILTNVGSPLCLATEIGGTVGGSDLGIGTYTASLAAAVAGPADVTGGYRKTAAFITGALNSVVASASDDRLRGDFTYSGNVVKSYSGAPIVQLDSGLVIGMVVENGVINNQELQEFHLGVRSDAIAAFLAPRLPPTVQFTPVHNGVETRLEGRDSLTNMRPSGYMRLLTLDSVAPDRGIPGFPFNRYENALVIKLHDLFQADFRVYRQSELDKPGNVQNIISDLRFRPCGPEGNEDTTAALVLRRRIIPRGLNKTKQVAGDATLLDCSSNVLATIILRETAITTASSGEVHLYADAVQEALLAVADQQPSRLVNLAYERLFLGNSELRSFVYFTRNANRSRVVGPAWAFGSFAFGFQPRLVAASPLLGLDGTIGTAFDALRDDVVAARIRAAEAAEADLLLGGGVVPRVQAASTQRPSWVRTIPQDRCWYLDHRVWLYRGAIIPS